MIIKRKKKNDFIIGLTVSIHHLKAHHETMKITARNVLFLFFILQGKIPQATVGMFVVKLRNCFIITIISSLPHSDIPL